VGTVTEAVTAGTVLGDRFEIVGTLARGALGEVFDARDKRTGTPVAVKVVHAALVPDETARRRLISATEDAERVGVPHILGVLGSGWDESHDATWFAMEKLEGESLRARLHNRPRPSPSAVLPILEAIAAPLAEAHAKGLVHGDVKPENVFYERDRGRGGERVVLLDFAIGRAVRESDRASAYLAPEQSYDSLWITPAADVWALGAMAYELFTGSPPFEGADAEQLLENVRRTPHVPLLRVVPFAVPAVASVIDRALAKDPGLRPPTARAFIDELRKAVAPPPPPEPERRPFAGGGAGGGRIVSLAGPGREPSVVRPRTSSSWVWWVVGVVGLAAFCIVGPFVLLIGLGMFAAATAPQPQPYDPYGPTSLPPPIDPNIGPVAPDDPNAPSTPPSPGDIQLTPLGPPSGDPGQPGTGGTDLPPVLDGTLPPEALNAERREVPITLAQPELGPRDALVTIVVFSDFQCPFCGRVEPTLARVRETYGDDVRFIWRNNPLPFHSRAMPAAEAAMEARTQGGDEKFWRMHDVLFANQSALETRDLEQYARGLGLDAARFRRALDSGAHRAEIRADMDLAQQLDANGTPTFFVNGVVLTGAQPYERFQEAVDRELVVARALVARGTPRDQVYDSLMMLARARGLVGAGAGTGSSGSTDEVIRRRRLAPLGDPL